MGAAEKESFDHRCHATACRPKQARDIRLQRALPVSPEELFRCEDPRVPYTVLDAAVEASEPRHDSREQCDACRVPSALDVARQRPGDDRQLECATPGRHANSLKTNFVRNPSI